MVKRTQYTLGNPSDPIPVPEGGKFLRRTLDNSAWEFVNINTGGSQSLPGVLALGNATDGYNLIISEGDTLQIDGSITGGILGGDLSGSLPNPSVVDLTITSQAQGDVLYFNGSNWVRLAASTDGYFLTTHGAEQNPSYTAGTTLARTTDFPADTTKSAALVGTSAYAARSDHKHNISTAAASTLSGSNTEGTSTSLARADHNHALGGTVGGDLSGTLPNPNVTDLTITNEAQGDILYYNGSNWVRLAAGDDGYFLTTHGPGENPTYTGINSLSRTTDLPADVTKAPALVGTSAFAARADHKHNISTAAASTLSGSNSEGSATSLARSDHNHALGGTVGGDLNGTLPNPAVVDLTITSEQQGSIIYYNGSNWVQLSPGTDGYFLTTHGAGQNPTYTGTNPLSRITDLPANVTKSSTLVGTSAYGARADHKHDINTASAVSVGVSNAEGSSSSLARADHTHAVTDLSISSQAQGDILYYNGANWVRLAAGTDGYFLTTKGAGQNPIYSAGITLARSTDFPADVTKAPALVGTSPYVARSDHKHNISTAAASTLSGSNSEGSATSLARSDHNHALGGTVGGDLNGTLPNPTVVDLTITNETQGDILYYNGANWVRLAAGTDGYFLTTHGASQNPTYTGVAPLARATDFPADVTKSAALVGTSAYVARADHKHNISTATATSVGTTNAEGTATSLARSDHTHAVTGLSISSQAQGDILYYNGSAWVRLAAGTDGYALITHGSGQNPTWGPGISPQYVAFPGSNSASTGFIRLRQSGSNPSAIVGRSADGLSDIVILSWGDGENDRILLGANTVSQITFDTKSSTGIHTFRIGGTEKLLVNNTTVTTNLPTENPDDTVGNVKAFASTSQNSVEDTDFDPNDNLTITVAITAGTWGAVEMRAVVFDTSGTNSTICLFEKTGQASFHRASGNTIQIGDTIYNDGYFATENHYAFTIAASSTNMVGTLDASSNAPSNAAAMIVVTRFEADKPG